MHRLGGRIQIIISIQKNDKFLLKFVVFYSSRRLGMESRGSVYVIAVGVCHPQRGVLRLDYIPSSTDSIQRFALISYTLWRD